MANIIAQDLKRLFGPGSKMIPKLILINLIIFLVVNIAMAADPAGVSRWILDWFALSGNLQWAFVKIYGFFTYNFLHLTLGHVFWNMFTLWFIGRILEDLVGSKRVLHAYILGGFAGGLAYLLVHNISLLFAGVDLLSSGGTLNGASAAVMGVIVAAATISPNFVINLLFFGPVRLIYVVLALVVMSSIINLWDNTGGKVAHLGGAAMGYYFVVQMQKGTDWGKPLDQIWGFVSGLFVKKPKMRVVHRDTSGKSRTRSSTTTRRPSSGGPSKGPMSESERQRKTDAILDKISKSGWDSLTKAEKDFLANLKND